MGLLGLKNVVTLAVGLFPLFIFIISHNLVVAFLVLMFDMLNPPSHKGLKDETFCESFFFFFSNPFVTERETCRLLCHSQEKPQRSWSSAQGHR